MRTKAEKKAAAFRKHRSDRRRLCALLQALCCFFSATAALPQQQISAAVTGGERCAIEAHVHTDACYETVLICGYDEHVASDIHTHTDACRETRLICGKEEHIHSRACIPDRSADTETADVWESTLPGQTADSLREQLARTAESQLGYTESERNFCSDSGTKMGYTRYGAWYGVPYGDWEQMFVHFCLHYAGVPSERIPERGNCRIWSHVLATAGLIRTAENGTPLRGDVLLIDCDEDGEADRAGIVTHVQNTDEGVRLTAVEGDYEESVTGLYYQWDDPCVIGYVSPEDPALLSALEYGAESDSGIRVSASADTDTFPYGTVMDVTDVSSADAMEIARAAADRDTQICSAVAFDITFLDTDGYELEPADGQTVRIRITLPDNTLSGDSFTLLHQLDDGTVEEIPDAAITADTVSFDADAFSIYIVSGGSETLVVGNTMNEAHYTADDPYVMKVGETLRLAGYSNIERYLYPTDQSIIVKDGGADDWITSQWINGQFKTEADFIAKKAGNTTILLEYQADSGEIVYQMFYIRVEQTPDSILVLTHLDPDGKGYNHIKESLSYSNGSTTINTANVEGYIPNGPLDYPSANAPYTLYPGQEVEFFPLIPEGGSPDNPPQLTIRLDGGNPSYPDEWRYYFTQVPATSGKPGAIRLRADRPGRMIIVKNESTEKEMFINVRDSQRFTHADMEIADGGRYVTSFPAYDENGNQVTRVRVYNAYVDYVNWSRIYKADNSEITSFTSAPDPNRYWAPDGEYKKIGEIGSSQYEYTSAFCGKPNDGCFEINETDHAKFNVNMTLVPNYEYTIYSDGTESVQIPLDKSEDKRVYFKNLEFDLNKQDVIDALNKCPYTNGLDFTLQEDITEIISSHVVVPEVTKVLENGKLQDQQFEFELVEQNVEEHYDYTIKQQWNDGEHIGKQDKEFRIIPDGYIFDECSQIIQPNPYGEGYVWGENIDGQGLENALRSEYEFYIRDIYTPDSVYGFLNQAIEFDWIDSLRHFIRIAKNYITGTTEIEEGDLHFAIPKKGYYMFRFKEPHDEPQTARNNAVGTAEFQKLQFHDEGTYYYKVREIVPENADENVIAYDKHTATVKITIRKENGKFVKEITILDENGNPGTLRFVNRMIEYLLPGTGGIGRLPFFLGGTAICMLSLTLYLYCKRKEESGIP